MEGGGGRGAVAIGKARQQRIECSRPSRPGGSGLAHGVAQAMERRACGQQGVKPAGGAVPAKPGQSQPSRVPFSGIAAAAHNQLRIRRHVLPLSNCRREPRLYTARGLGSAYVPSYPPATTPACPHTSPHISPSAPLDYKQAQHPRQAGHSPQTGTVPDAFTNWPPW